MPLYRAHMMVFRYVQAPTPDDARRLILASLDTDDVIAIEHRSGDPIGVPLMDRVLGTDGLTVGEVVR